MSLKLYNTLSRQKEEFVPIDKNEVRMYTCGPTVYNFAHIGNLRTYIFEDILRRTLKYFGYSVRRVMNITDVDDKTIRDSIAAGVSLSEYTEKYKLAFFEDLKTLSIENAEVYPEATKHIKEMINLIQILFDKGYAYKSQHDNSVYFRISQLSKYGVLVKINMGNQMEQVAEEASEDEYEAGENGTIKNFALWKNRTKEDGNVFWESPWGQGRPGWHIECSAMSMKYLGKTFDIHTGGVDNMFPHHENEIAQSEAANGVKFVNYWLHGEHLIVNGQKMSKSLNNFYTLRDILKMGFEPAEIRWALMSTHYRKKLNFTIESMTQTREIIRSFRKFFLRLKEIINVAPTGPQNFNSSLGFTVPGNCEKNITTMVTKHLNEFKESLGDDLNISGALAAVFNLQREANKMMATKELDKTAAELILKTFESFDSVLAVFDLKEEIIPEEITQLAEERNVARKSKDFAKSDFLRKKIKEKGWDIEDISTSYRITKL